MNKKALSLYGIIVSLTLVTFWGCQKKTLNDVIPTLKMVSIQKLDSDSVAVTGTIVSNSGYDIGYEGFCYGTDAVPDVTENQKLIESDSTTFSAHLYVKPGDIYYFRCFAANSYGYGVSGSLK